SDPVRFIEEKVAIRHRGRVGFRLPQTAKARAADGKEHIEDEGVAVHELAATIGLDSVEHDEPLRRVARGNLHDQSRLAANVRDAEGCRAAELRERRRVTAILQRRSGRGGKIAVVEVPLPGGGASSRDWER